MKSQIVIGTFLCCLFILNSTAYTQVDLDLQKLYGEPIEKTETSQTFYAREDIIRIRVDYRLPSIPTYEIFPEIPLKFISHQSSDKILSEIFPEASGFKETFGFTFNNRCNGWHVKFFENGYSFYKVIKSSTCQPVIKITIEKDIKPIKFSREFKL